MRFNKGMSYWVLAAVVGTVHASVTLAAAGDPTPTTKPKAGLPFVGEVTGDGVYVRSQPDQNWYPTTKLSRGDRVEVHAEQYGWYGILPPRGSFCYIAKSLVERDRDAGKGVITGDNVYVRVGSQLPRYAREKKSVAARLNKGAEVTIIGDHPDGMYKVQPPKGALYWISATFIRKVGSDVTKAPAKVTESIPPLESTEKKATPDKAAELGTQAEPSKTDKELPAKPAQSLRLVDVWQKKLDLVDAELKAALRQKPWREGDFRLLRKRFVPISKQADEEVPQAFAKIRLEQIDNILERIIIREQINSISAGLEKVEKPTTSRRAKIKPKPIKPDYQGKLVRSFAFEGRYRIVDRNSGRTQAYLEFPKGSKLNPSDFVGRFVQVRMKRRYYDKDAGQNVVEPADIVVVGQGPRKAGEGPRKATEPKPKSDAESPKPKPTPIGKQASRPVGPSQPVPSANQPASLDAPEK